MSIEAGSPDDERLKQIETAIVALRITLQSMLIFLTLPRGDKAYDDVLIGMMRDSLVEITKSWDFGGYPDEIKRRSDLEKIITELLGPLSRAKS